MKNRFIKRIQEIMDVFARIATGISAVTAVYISVFWGSDTNIGNKILWQILFVAFLCAVGTLMLPLGDDEKELGKWKLFGRIAIYYAYINLVVFLCGAWFNWFYFSNAGMVIGMELCIVVVFGVVAVLNWFAQYREAIDMNEKLSERE